MFVHLQLQISLTHNLISSRRSISSHIGLARSIVGTNGARWVGHVHFPLIGQSSLPTIQERKTRVSFPHRQWEGCCLLHRPSLQSQFQPHKYRPLSLSALVLRHFFLALFTVFSFAPFQYLCSHNLSKSCFVCYPSPDNKFSSCILAD